jgi:hypothetical protein
MATKIWSSTRMDSDDPASERCVLVLEDARSNRLAHVLHGGDAWGPDDFLPVVELFKSLLPGTAGGI